MTSDRKSVLSYSLYNMPAREAALFESFVRLMGNTRHRWRLVQGRQEEADVPVVYDDSFYNGVLDWSRPGLMVGKQPRRLEGGHCLYLALPMRSDRLEKCLNHLGDMVLRQPSTPPNLDSQFATLADMDSTAAQKPAATVELPLLQLLRWPPQVLLPTRQQLHLAMLLMAGLPITLKTLSTISGLPLQTCSEFVDTLRRHGLLSVSVPSATSTKAERETRQSNKRNTSLLAPRPRQADGFLARVRRHLGLDTTSIIAQHGIQNTVLRPHGRG